MARTKNVFLTLIVISCLSILCWQNSFASIDEYIKPMFDTNKITIDIPWQEVLPENIDVVVSELVEYLASAKGQKVGGLTLSAHILGVRRLQLLLEVFGSNPKLVGRGLIINDLEDNTMPILADFIRSNRTIEILMVFPQGEYGERFNLLTEAVAYNETLRELFFQVRNLGDNEFLLLARMLEINNTLQRLDLQKTDTFFPGFAVPIGTRATVYPGFVIHVGNRATAVGYAAIGNALLINRGLEFLNIGYNLEPALGALLLRGVLGNTRLTGMGIRYNPFSKKIDDMRGNIFFGILDRNRVIAENAEMLRGILIRPTARLIRTAQHADMRRGELAELSLFHNTGGDVINHMLAYAAYGDPYDVFYARLVQLLRTQRADAPDFVRQLTRAELTVFQQLQALQKEIDEHLVSLISEFGVERVMPPGVELPPPPLAGVLTQISARALPSWCSIL